MDQGERRIRNLHLRGTDDAQLRRARHLLEEAFRTASLPGLPPNSLVLVRHLDLGLIPLGLSASALSLHIEARVRELASSAICVDHLPQPRADVVWFSDPLQPCIQLMRQLLSDRTPVEWYWRSLFKGTLPQPNEAGVNRVLQMAMQTPLKGLAVAHVLDGCLEPPLLARLLPLISPQLARQLLHVAGVTPVAVATLATAQQTDTAAGQPVRGADADATPSLSAGWRLAISQAISLWGLADVRSHWIAYQALVLHHPAYALRRDSLQAVSRWLPRWQAWADLPTSAPAAVLPEAAVPQQHAQLESGVAPVAANRAVPAKTAPAPDSKSGTANNTAAPSVTSLDAPSRISGDVSTTQGQDANTPQPTKPPIVVDRAAGDEQHVPHSGSWSPCAGLGLLVSLLQRLGLAQLLSDHDELIRRDFPVFLLHAIARRCRMRPDDPQTALFEALSATASAAPIALDWPDVLRHSAVQLVPRLQLPDQVSLDQLARLLQVLMGRYLRRHCGMSLRQLVQRSGRVVLGRTHWDVIFDIEQTDLRLRRIALDSNPGWVPWLGKVVQFHYDTQGYRYV